MPERNCRCQNPPQQNNDYVAMKNLIGQSRYTSYDDSVELGLPYATSYVRPQTGIFELYCPAECLAKGTIFPELYQPYRR